MVPGVATILAEYDSSEDESVGSGWTESTAEDTEKVVADNNLAMVDLVLQASPKAVRALMSTM
eukprot:11901424-Karenia_brevis.AAC.1